eukprot:10892585-Alexandrium_andersonii.AAC.1
MEFSGGRLRDRCLSGRSARGAAARSFSSAAAQWDFSAARGLRTAGVGRPCPARQRRAARPVPREARPAPER